MKIQVHIDHLQELSAFIACLDKHRTGALILLAAVLGVPAVGLAAYFLLRHF